MSGTDPVHVITEEPQLAVAPKKAQQEKECDTTETRTALLKVAHADAVAEIERNRQCTGQLTTGINGAVGNSILEAGVLALTGHGDAEPKQFVVAAPPGTGKTSHAVALMAATVRTADNDDLSKPYGCLFVVDQIKKADDMYLQINAILPGRVAVWSTDHDVDASTLTQMFVPPSRRFHVDQLEQRAIVVVTQAFLRGPRGDKARQVLRGDHKVPRALTIFDEQTREVEVFDVRQSEAIRVKEIIEADARYGDVKTKMKPLLDFIRIQSERIGNAVEGPNDGAEEWRVAFELRWFTTDEAEQFVRNNREIKNLDKVFGFAAQMYNTCAFIYRRGGGDNGTYFMAYRPAATPSGNSVLLDATADIDGVSKLCAWRAPVRVPAVRYGNLHIVHAEPYTRKNLRDFFSKQVNRRNYAKHAMNIIREIMPAGSRGLIVCKKDLVDQGDLPKTTPTVTQVGEQPNPFTWDFEGRKLAVTWWGGHGIGANDWKTADYVFQFGEHILPQRTMFAMVQGLRGHTAMEGMLSTPQDSNRIPREVNLATEGHLLRFMKQMGMRGRARSFDQDGVCGKQVLVLTCDFARLLVYADQLFPGATLSKWGRTPRQHGTLKQTEMLLEILTEPDAPDVISGNDIARRMGVEKWSAISTNVMTDKLKGRVLPNLGWEYGSKRGPGGGSWFTKSGKAVLTPQALPSHALAGSKAIAVKPL